MKAVCINPLNVKKFLPLVSPLIKQAATHDDLDDYEGIESRLIDGTFFLWLACDGAEIFAAAVTRLELTNGVKFCTIVACGGRDLERWCDLINDLEAFARAEGCRSVRIYGRPGWQRKLDGYKPIATILEKEMT